LNLGGKSNKSIALLILFSNGKTWHEKCAEDQSKKRSQAVVTQPK
jgi:hypothetical protein